MITIRALMILFGLGDLVGLVHYFAHHRTGLTGLVLAFGGWVAHRWHRRFHNTGRRVMPKEQVRALREARKAAALTAATEAGTVTA